MSPALTVCVCHARDKLFVSGYIKICPTKILLELATLKHTLTGDFCDFWVLNDLLKISKSAQCRVFEYALSLFVIILFALVLTENSLLTTEIAFKKMRTLKRKKKGFRFMMLECRSSLLPGSYASNQLNKPLLFLANFSTILHRTNFHLSSKVDFAGWAICISSAFFFDMSKLVSTACLRCNIPTDIGVNFKILLWSRFNLKVLSLDWK